MARYLLNASVISSDGQYTYRTVTKEVAVAWLQSQRFESKVGYPNTVDYIEKISGVRVAINRDMINMQVGDIALIVRLKYRVPDPNTKGRFVPDENDYEFALLYKSGD